MDITDIVNVKTVRWPNGRMFGSRIIETTQFGELYFTIDWWIYFCHPDPNDENGVIATRVLPKTGMFTKTNQPINRTGDTL